MGIRGRTEVKILKFPEIKNRRGQGTREVLREAAENIGGIVLDFVHVLAHNPHNRCARTRLRYLEIII